MHPPSPTEARDHRGSSVSRASPTPAAPRPAGRLDPARASLDRSPVRVPLSMTPMAKGLVLGEAAAAVVTAPPITFALYPSGRSPSTSPQPRESGPNTSYVAGRNATLTSNATPGAGWVE